MKSFLKDAVNASRLGGRLACFAVLAGALLLLPGAAKADSGSDPTTYDVTGTFSNGVTIDSGSSFSILGNVSSGVPGTLDGATIITSVGTFSCTYGVTVPSACSLYQYGGDEIFNLFNTTGTEYLSIEIPIGDIDGPNPIPLTGTFIEPWPAGQPRVGLTSGYAVDTPEPGTLLLMLSGIAGLFFLGLRRGHA